MKKLIAIAAFAAAGVSSAFAQEAVQEAPLADLTATATIGFESEYIFRGFKQADESIQPSLEFALPVYEGSAYIGYWGNEATDETTNTENDLYIGYTQPITDIFSADAGFTYYTYSEATPQASNLDREKEIYFGVSADYWDLSPSVYAYYNFSREGFVIEGSVAHAIDLSEYAASTSLELGAYAGVVDYDLADGDQGGIAERENGYAYYGVTADVVYTLNEVASVSVGVRYVGNNDDVANQSDDFFFWGTSASFGF